ncbi:MAG: hypothetical protein ACI9VR_003989 [Cognaticolwellia sp.]|jgi:uncharacterized protein YndB with AHSA1/START domain
MSSITVSRNLAVPVQEVWAKLADFGGIHRYSAGVEHSPINPGTPSSGVGAERKCQLYDGNHIQERVTEFVENERLALDVFDTSMPISNASARFDLVGTLSGSTELTMTMDYTVKFGPIGWLMDNLMLRNAMTSSLNNLLAALEHHLTTGAIVEKGWKQAA